MATVDDTNSFVTLADARAFLDLEDTDTDLQEVIVALINRTAAAFNDYTARNLKVRTYTSKLLDAEGGLELFLPEYPIDTSEELTVYADQNRAFDYEWQRWDGSGSSAGYDYFVDQEQQALVSLVDVWPRGRSVVRITYTAGLDDGLDSPIAQAQLRQVSEWYGMIGRDPALSNFSAGGVSFGLAGAGNPFGIAERQALLPDVVAVLKAYKSWGIC